MTPTRTPDLCYAPTTPYKLARSIKALNTFTAFARRRRQEPDHPTPSQVSRELAGICREYFRAKPDTPGNETDFAVVQRIIAHAIADAFNLETPREVI